MSIYLQTILPHAGAALVMAAIMAAILGKYAVSRRVQLIAIVPGVILLLVPLLEYNVTHYIRVLTGDLSATGFIVFGILLWRRLGPDSELTEQRPIRIAVVLSAIAAVFYPTSLGLTYLDLYAYGFHPIVLGPVVFATFAFCVWFGHRLAATILCAAFICFSLGLLESDNLWDYLLDPITAAYCVTLVIRSRHALPSFRPSQQHIETGAAIVIATFLLFSVYLAQVNQASFRYEFTVEDGFVEWCTVIVLLTAMVVCGKRFLRLRGVRPKLFLGVTAFLTLLCLFGAGEEISWGQRIFGIETPDYLKERNAQGELGLHNLVIEVNGERVKINKLVFGTGLALMLSIYLFVATPLYRRNARVRRFFNQIAAPMPRNYHIAGYLLILATVELLIDSGKRGEMTEFAGSIMFALNIAFPYNPEIFDRDKTL